MQYFARGSLLRSNYRYWEGLQCYVAPTDTFLCPCVTRAPNNNFWCNTLHVALCCATITVCLSCLLYTSPSPRDSWATRMPSSACSFFECSNACKVLHQKLLLGAPVKQGQKNVSLGTTLPRLPITVIGAQQRATCKVLHQKLLLGALVTQGHKNVSVGAT